MKYSVVIPTRNRPQTLASCIKSCLVNPRDDIEVVVCDNSDPAQKSRVRQIFTDIFDCRVRLCENPQSPCSMSANWAFALTQAKGEYVTLLGDDDGLLSYAFDVADLCVEQSNCKILHWIPALYWWPCAQDKSSRRLLKLNFGQWRGKALWKRKTGKEFLELALRVTDEWYQLPMVYNCFLHHEIIADLRSRFGERFLPAPSPDIFSGVAIAALSPEIMEIDCPLNIHGLSGGSNGEAHVLEGTDRSTAIKSDFWQLLRSEGICDLAEVANEGCFALGVSDCFYRFAKLSPDKASAFHLDRKTLARNQATEIARSHQSLQSRTESLERLTGFFGPEPDCVSEVIAVLTHLRASEDGPNCGFRNSKVLGIGYGDAYFDGGKFGLSAISEAADFVSHLLCVRAVSPAYQRNALGAALKRIAPPILVDLLRSMRSIN